MTLTLEAHTGHRVRRVHGGSDAPDAGSGHRAPEDFRYHVSITLHREHEPGRVTLALTEAFNQGADGRDAERAVAWSGPW